MKSPHCAPLIDDFYRQYLVEQDCEVLVERVLDRYSVGSLERLASHDSRLTRRAAVLVIGLAGDYSASAVLGRALVDPDRGVRTLAENGIRGLWCRSGSLRERRRLATVIRMNAAERFQAAVRHASKLLELAPELAEAWHQRAKAHYRLGDYSASIADCQRALELNPYHFEAATGLGECRLKQGECQAALESFRGALRLNPGLEGVRAQVHQLQRTLNN